MIDGGVTWVNNQHGGSAFLFSGMLSPDMLTFGGSDDLGGDNKAIFELTSQLDPGSGATIPDPGQIFCRTALIGLAHDRLDTLTFGEQYDFLFETLTLGRYDGAFLLGIYGYRQGPFSALGVPNNPTGSFDFDRMAGATRVGNWVK